MAVSLEMMTESPSICESLQRADALPGTTNGFLYAAKVHTTRPPAHLTPRVVPFHEDAIVPLELSLICWASESLVADAPAPTAASA